MEELTIPLELKTYLTDIVEQKFGYRLGEPWKYDETALGVVVPIFRDNAPERPYTTMYEVLKNLDMKDTGQISKIELQNNTKMAIFVRAGTIFSGGTQPRAAKHSGVYREEKQIIPVCCVNRSYGIRGGTKMGFGDIAPPSVTIELMTGNQDSVWKRVRQYTREREESSNYITEIGAVKVPEDLPEEVKKVLDSSKRAKMDRSDRVCHVQTYTNEDGESKTNIRTVLPTEDVQHLWSGKLTESQTKEVNDFADNLNKIKRETKKRRRDDYPRERGLGPRRLADSSTYYLMSPGGSRYASSRINSYHIAGIETGGTDDLLGDLEKGRSSLDDMMQKVPFFPEQVGAVLFNPVGVIALETFDHPKSWESIKKEIVEKLGDKMKETQAEHLFELKKDKIIPSLQKFVSGLDSFAEKTISKDDYSETRQVRGKDVIGEYTIVKGQPIHVLLLKEEKEEN